MKIESFKRRLYRFQPFLHRLVRPSPSGRGVGLFALASLGALYLLECGSPVIFDDNEGLYAGAAHEMRARGDWIVPTLDGMPRCQKPPLVYWLILLSTSLFGENELAVRLPQALASLLWMAATYRLGAALGGQSLGQMAALILGTAFGSFVFGHIIMPEIFLAASIAWSFWFLWKALTGKEKDRYGIGLWASMAFGAMAKGLHALIYPLLVAGLLALFSRTLRKEVRHLFPWQGIALFLLLVAPWYLAMEGRLPGFLQEHFGNEQLGHAVNHRIPPDAGTVHLPIFLGEQIIFLLPWSLFGGALLFSVLFPVPRAAPAVLEEQPVGLLLGLWILLTFLSLLPSSLQDYYALGCFPALALLLARPFCEVREGRPHWTFWIPFAAVAGLAVAAAIAGIAYGTNEGLGRPSIVASPVDQRDNFLAAIFGFSFNTWRAFVPLLLWASASLFLGGTAGLWLAWHGKRLASGICLALAMLLPLKEAGAGFRLMGDYFSSEKIARYLNRLATTDRRIVADGEPNFSSSLFFYLQGDRVYWVHSSSASSFSLRSSPEGRKLYLSEAEFLELWAGERTVYWICEESAMKHWKRILDEKTPSWSIVLRCGTRVLAVNRLQGGLPDHD
ncbi:glycosyltransferase family 39 protein [Methylacidimicrobium sp. B4]|uniref:ArnT family glycosyltransferase n=1 Tax=Methylacidimicrobium sp. B4 TaxID=2796139 RepID=UPI001A8F4302|nr:glycosyltransferase family 39 protein [Methylacidimicrobium sp. B4]QSR84526.1 glycosyltransferase family 39 protein [Methylacidimicrobium sp. B4]